MVFKLKWEISECEIWGLILWNAFCAAMPIIWGTNTHFTGYILRRKIPMVDQKCSPLVKKVKK